MIYGNVLWLIDGSMAARQEAGALGSAGLPMIASKKLPNEIDLGRDLDLDP